MSHAQTEMASTNWRILLVIRRTEALLNLNFSFSWEKRNLGGRVITNNKLNLFGWARRVWGLSTGSIFHTIKGKQKEQMGVISLRLTLPSAQRHLCVWDKRHESEDYDTPFLSAPSMQNQPSPLGAASRFWDMKQHWSPHAWGEMFPYEISRAQPETIMHGRLRWDQFRDGRMLWFYLCPTDVRKDILRCSRAFVHFFWMGWALVS